MPIYEFYCPDCHRIFSFLSRTIDTEKIPACPKCGRASLSRRVSPFAVISGGGSSEEGEGGMPDLPIDEGKMERAMMALASEMEGADDNDPRAAAQFMKNFSNLTGLELNDSMKEALRRMEAGEEPETIEAEMGDLFAGDEMPFVMPGQKGAGKRLAPPSRDETLYEF